MKLRFLMKSDTLICVWIYVSNWHNWSFDTTKMKFLTSLQILERLLTSKYLIPSSTNHVGEMERWEKRVFQLLQMPKNKISWNKEAKCVTDFYWYLGLLLWRIILVIKCWAHKRQTFTLISIQIMCNLNFFTLNRVFKHMEVFSNLNILVTALGKCELHTYFTF